MGKPFAQIDTSLLYSQKMRQLNHQEKWAYICAHLSPNGGYLGTFRYPISMWAEDADLSPTELKKAISKLEEVGLITFDPEESYVRIIAWFMKKNAPENASRMASLAADFSVIDAPDSMVISSAAEFAVGAIKRAQRWKSESSEWQKLRNVFKPFLKTMRQNYEDDFHQALVDQLKGQNRAIKTELCALMPSLQYYLEAPCPHPAQHETKRHETDTKLT